jgi:hypothetical protein
LITATLFWAGWLAYRKGILPHYISKFLLLVPIH